VLEQRVDVGQRAPVPLLHQVLQVGVVSQPVRHVTMPQMHVVVALFVRAPIIVVSVNNKPSINVEQDSHVGAETAGWDSNAAAPLVEQAAVNVSKTCEYLVVQALHMRMPVRTVVDKSMKSVQVDHSKTNSAELSKSSLQGVEVELFPL